MTLLGPSLQSYFTDHARAQRDLSPNTIGAYRDTWRLLIKYVTATRNIPADKIDLAVIDATLVSQFLDHLQTARGNGVSTRNARLTAIRAVMGFALPDHPEHAHTIAPSPGSWPSRSGGAPHPPWNSSPPPRRTRCWPPRTRGPGLVDATRPC